MKMMTMRIMILKMMTMMKIWKKAHPRKNSNNRVVKDNKAQDGWCRFKRMMKKRNLIGLKEALCDLYKSDFSVVLTKKITKLIKLSLKSGQL
jgi:hypothetical protein